MEKKQNFIEARTKQDFAVKLCSTVQRILSDKLSFDNCISWLYYLGGINLDYFLTGYGEQKLEKTFSGRTFNIPETQCYGHFITTIKNKNTYEIIVCHAIEHILRIIMNNKENFNNLLALLIQNSANSKLLKGYIRRCFSAYWEEDRRTWTYGNDLKSEKVELFPFYFEKRGYKLYSFAEYIPSDYEGKFLEIFSLLNVVMDLNLPLGEYEYSEDFKEEEIEFYHIKRTITFDINTFKVSFNNIYFMIHNANLGISHKITNIKNLDFLLGSNLSVEQLVVFLLSVRVNLELNSIDMIDCIKSMILRILAVNNVTLDDLIQRKVFKGKKVFCETIIHFLNDLNSDTLFRLALDPSEYMDCVDYKGIIIKDYLKNYIIKIQTKRYKSNIDLDRSMRSVINSTNFKNKQLLLMILFSDLDYTINLK